MDLAQAQIEVRELPGDGSRLVDVNDFGLAITRFQYYDFTTQTLTNMESGVSVLSAINNNGDVAGEITYDSENLQPGYRKDGVWHGTGWFEDAIIEEADFITTGISPNGKYVVALMSKDCCIFGTLLYDTETNELFDVFSNNTNNTLYPNQVTNNGLIAGWYDQPNSSGTLRYSAFYDKDLNITTVPIGETPTQTLNETSAINSSNMMAGNYNGAPFIYDEPTDTFTTLNSPGGNYATFTDISDNGIAVGYEVVGPEAIDRKAIIYHPNIDAQPVYLKEYLEDLGATITTSDGLLNTAFTISPNGNYVAGWGTGHPIFAKGWIIYLDDILGVSDIEHPNSEISLYPNPIKDVLHINTENTIENISIFNPEGQQAKNISTSNDYSTVDFSGLAKGVYIVTIDDGKKTQSFKVIKE